MKRTVREKNSIIISFVFYLILVVFLVLFVILNTSKKIEDINLKKIETQVLYNNLKTVLKEWLSFDEFSSLSSSSQTDNEILKNITKEFYDNHLKNIDNESFDEFIKEKTDELNSEENIKLIKDNKKQIINILPTYLESNIKLSDEQLSDYKFINYVESIIESFNLTTWGSIGIWNVVLLEDYAVTGSNWDTLESSIYSIPLSINLKWTKSNIIDFLYFIEKVWTIEIENNEINITKDNGFLSTNGFPKVLAWDKYIKNYNIFENQIIDIENFEMTEYIDSSYNSKWNIDLLEFIKSEQGSDDFEVKVSLNFYVKWLPKYEILKFINWVLTNYKLINAKVNQLVSSNGAKWIELINLKKDQNLLKNLNTKIVNINAELRKQKDLESVYKTSIEVNEYLQPICEKFDWICK